MTARRTWKRCRKRGKRIWIQGKGAASPAEQNPTGEGVGNQWIRVCRQHLPESLLTWLSTDKQALQYLTCQCVLNLNMSLCIITSLCRMAKNKTGTELPHAGQGPSTHPGLCKQVLISSASTCLLRKWDVSLQNCQTHTFPPWILLRKNGLNVSINQGDPEHSN